MAKKAEEKSKVALERTYIIPLRRDVHKSPAYKRAKKAINVVRQFLEKHMKSDNIKIHNSINLELWKNGIKSPPGKVKVNVKKDSEGRVDAYLFGVQVDDAKPKAEAPLDKKTKQKLEKKLEEAVEKKKEEAKDKVAASVKKEEPKAKPVKETKVEEKPKTEEKPKEKVSSEKPKAEPKTEEKKE